MIKKIQIYDNCIDRLLTKSLNWVSLFLKKNKKQAIQLVQPNWNPKLKDIFGHETRKITMTSPSKGNEYKTDVVPQLEAFSKGAVEEAEDGNIVIPL